MKITIETLKANKAEIVSFITETYGAPYVKEVMEEMVSGISNTEETNVLEFAKYVAEYELGLDVKGSRKESKNAAILGKLNEMENN